MAEVLVVMALAMESEGVFETANIPVLYTGVGKVNAAHALTRALVERKARGQPMPLVVNFGTAGSNRHQTHAYVACRRFLQRDMDVRGLGFKMGETPLESIPAMLEFPPVFTALPEGVCGTGDRFETQEHEAHCDVIDMEAYALAKVCHLEGAPFACAKFVSDGANPDSAGDWKANVALAAKRFLELYLTL